MLLNSIMFQNQLWKDAIKGRTKLPWGQLSFWEQPNEMVHTKFLRRCDLKKNRTMKFRELTEEDEEEMFGVHSKEQVKLILPPPTNHRGTARTRGSLVFQDERLDKFATYIE